MEPPRRLTLIQRGLAVLLLAGVMWTATLEASSPAAASARTGAAWAGWLALTVPGSALPQLSLALYNPTRRTLDLIHVPETAGTPPLSKAYAQARQAGASEIDAARAMTEAARPLVEPLLTGRIAAEPGFRHVDAAVHGPDPELAARRWLAGRTRGARFWNHLWKDFEAFRIGLEVHRMRDDDLRAARLPDEPGKRAAYFAWLLEPRELPDQPVTAEVLNTTDRKGVAFSATKVLRSRGVDVVSTGNAEPRSRTVVYDRTGRPELAAVVKRALDCPTAEAATWVDAKRLVDVSVHLADDCFIKE